MSAQETSRGSSGRAVPPCLPTSPRRGGGGSARAVRRLEVPVAVVTPLFGGGPVAGDNDPVTPVRGAAVRGHLRFWWRATRGAEARDAEELRAREGAVWGTTDRTSPVTVRVHPTERGRAVQCARYEWQERRRKWSSLPEFTKGYPPYVLFPFKGDKPPVDSPDARPQEEPKKAIEGLAFTLVLEYPEELEQDVLAAVWAWVNFGGLGARTRRGCGSLYSPLFSPKRGADVHAWYAESIRRYGLRPANQASEARDWPTLPQPSRVLVKAQQGETPVDAWNLAVEMLRRFRQGVGLGRNQGADGRPGRSRWPEADTLRRLTCSAPTHAQPVTGKVDGFPRAELGLPIIFHFKDAGDPPDAELLPPGGKTRMASPLIIKALAMGRDYAVPMVACLTVKELAGARVVVRGTRARLLPGVGGETGYPVTVRNPSFAEYPGSPLARRSNKGSALEAFLEYVRREFGEAQA